MINLGNAITEIYMFSYNEDISHLVGTTETLRWYSCVLERSFCPNCECEFFTYIFSLLHH